MGNNKFNEKKERILQQTYRCIQQEPTESYWTQRLLTLKKVRKKKTKNKEDICCKETRRAVGYVLFHRNNMQLCIKNFLNIFSYLNKIMLKNKKLNSKIHLRTN